VVARNACGHDTLSRTARTSSTHKHTPHHTTPHHTTPHSFIAASASLPADQVLSDTFKLHTKLMHRYSAPVEVDLTVEFSGTDLERLLLVNIKVCVWGGTLTWWFVGREEQTVLD